MIAERVKINESDVMNKFHKRGTEKNLTSFPISVLMHLRKLWLCNKSLRAHLTTCI